MVINENIDRLTTHDLIGIAYLQEKNLEVRLDEVDGVENIDSTGPGTFSSKNLG